MLSYQETPIQEIKHEMLIESGVKLFVKREDLNHPYASGNKWWKLKYNLLEANRLGCKTLLTFGGAYSNHIYATAAAAKECGLDSIGIIRGEERLPLNPTLTFAKDQGMQIHYITRTDYRNKTDEAFLNDLRARFRDFYLIPEGGTNQMAIKGVREFAEVLLKTSFDYLCVPVGTGGTLTGLIEGLRGVRNIIGYSVLKGEFLNGELHKLLKMTDATHYVNWKLETNYHHGGYGKVTKELLAFINEFEIRQGVSFDPIYTGKMMWGIFEDIKRGFFAEGSTILAVHTGGLQGWSGLR